MKFTSEDLAKAMGLKIGDRIKLENGEIAEVIEDYDLWFESSELKRYGLYTISGQNFEILPPKNIKKKVGDLICCNGIYCADCPLHIMHCEEMRDESLYDNLEYIFEDINDKEIYDILKARLDKEVKE